jgi:hypothetical protein
LDEKIPKICLSFVQEKSVTKIGAQCKKSFIFNFTLYAKSTFALKSISKQYYFEHCHQFAFQGFQFQLEKMPKSAQNKNLSNFLFTRN